MGKLCLIKETTVNNFLNAILASGLLLFGSNHNTLKGNEQILKKSLVNDQTSITNIIDTLTNTEAKYTRKRYISFQKNFPNSKWSISNKKQINDFDFLIDIKVEGENNKFEIESIQTIRLNKINNGKFTKKILKEETLLKSKGSSLIVNAKIPDRALSGTKYDLDIVIDNPLDNSILAGGIALISEEEFRNNTPPKIKLIPIGSGGLFKVAKAPLKPTIQYWGIILAHKEGIIALTKMVRIVNKLE